MELFVLLIVIEVIFSIYFIAHNYILRKARRIMDKIDCLQESIDKEALLDECNADIIAALKHPLMRIMSERTYCIFDSLWTLVKFEREMLIKESDVI